MALTDFFFERVAHDLRQQMDGVLALTDQLGRHRLTTDAEACVESVAETAAGVRRTLDAALDVMSLARDGLRQECAPVGLRDLMDEVQARWASKASEGGITVLVSYDGDPEAAVTADRMRLHQIFDGFIAEAAGSHGRGTVEASVHAVAGGDGVTLHCRIRGARDGAWSETCPDARFREIEHRLGLEAAISAMLARDILQALGGETQDREADGVAGAAAFRLTLAAVAAEAEEAQTAAQRAAHILVVDDNATNRMVAQSLVEMFDCTSESAEDGVEAVEAARTGRFDLILMDIRMPRMDGVAATKAIRAMGGMVGATPIIALTANADPEDQQAYLAAGMNGVVEKPMKPEHLLLALQKALEPPSDSQAAAAAA